jgi:hypothetical protein
VWGEWDAQVGTIERFRATRAPGSPLELLPPDVRDGLGDAGAGALGLATPDGPVVLPARWLAAGGAIHAILPGEVLALTGAGPTLPVALQVDRASWWRAREMLGAMIRGQAEVAVLERLATGATSAASIATRAGAEPAGAAVLRIRPERLVWWRGWSSGSVVPP